MKKLMIAAAIVCAAVCSQAANFSWGLMSDSIKDPSDGWLEGGLASLYIDGTLIATASQDPKNYNFGVFDNSAVDTTGKVQTLADGSISGSFVGQAYKIVLAYNDGKDDWTYTYNGVSSYNQVTGAPGEPAKNFEAFYTDYAVQAGDWVKAVPEPTSGLLLLLGVAGLALRRRRA